MVTSIMPYLFMRFWLTDNAFNVSVLKRTYQP